MPSRETILCVNIFYKRLHSCWFLRIKNRFSVFGTLVCELMPSQVEKIAEQNTEKNYFYNVSKILKIIRRKEIMKETSLKFTRWDYSVVGKRKTGFLFLKRRPSYSRRLLERFHTMPSIGLASWGWRWLRKLKDQSKTCLFLSRNSEN